MRRLVGLAVVGLATLAPTWAHADDEKIAQEILGKLQLKKEAGQLKGFGIDLEVEDGTVWMKGHVASQEQHRIAIDIARRVPGVEKVVNELTVKGPAPVAKRASAQLQSESEATLPEESAMIASDELIPEAKPLEAKPIVKAELPKPVTRGSQAGKPSLLSSLSGGVYRALGSTVEGHSNSSQVQKVTHEDEGEPQPKSTRISEAKSSGGQTGSVENNEIVQQIAKKLQAEKQAGRLKGFNVDLECIKGVVTVTGHVSDSEQHTRVIEIVRRVRGVKQVVNDLKVSGTERGINHNDPTSGIAEGTGVAKQASTPTPYAETAHHGPRAPSPVSMAQAQSGLQMIPVPVQLVPAPMMMQPQYMARPQTPLAFAPSQAGGGAMQAQNLMPIGGQPGTPMPAHMPGPNVGIAPARYDHPNMPGYSWPSYAAYPNYAAVSYPKQYSPSAWPYIGPFYPYPQVPLGWRKVMLQWDDGLWYLDFKDK